MDRAGGAIVFASESERFLRETPREAGVEVTAVAGINLSR
jgi:hypothetical protein